MRQNYIDSKNNPRLRVNANEGAFCYLHCTNCMTWLLKRCCACSLARLVAVTLPSDDGDDDADDGDFTPSTPRRPPTGWLTHRDAWCRWCSGGRRSHGGWKMKMELKAPFMENKRGAIRFRFFNLCCCITTCRAVLCEGKLAHNNEPEEGNDAAKSIPPLPHWKVGSADIIYKFLNKSSRLCCCRSHPIAAVAQADEINLRYIACDRWWGGTIDGRRFWVAADVTDVRRRRQQGKGKD